ncbi:MAG: bifunctional folylpolyglutamate synthase/dihydrofolate synthase [Clostridia bacterium]|nr:bifunctional folylpolyglutamate synthase/dihydrofolate synthase [Clostridia bacterium]
MTYEEALEYIHSVCWKGSRPGLERITELCHRLGDPQKKLRFVHVAGTNGKGSTCSMLTSILMKAGKKVGTFTSPFIFEFRERMCVDGEMISCDDLSRATEFVRPHADAMEDSPTEFELITAIAFVYFMWQECDIVVLEAGLGGRLDSTNVIDNAEVSVITSIALEHTEYLGDTTAKIAAEKAGIIKCGCPVVAGKTDNDAAAVIKEAAESAGSAFHTPDSSLITSLELSLGGCTFDYDTIKNINLPLVGTYQPFNATVAITAARVMGIGDDTIREGLAAVKWPGRFEIVEKDPLIIYDGGHNIQCAEAVADTLRALECKKMAILTAVMADKEYHKMAEILTPFARRVYCVTPTQIPRALGAEAYAEVYSELGVNAVAAGSVEAGLRLAMGYAKAKNIPLLVTGSLYLYREFRDALSDINNMP